MRLTAAIDKIRPCIVQIALVATSLSQASKELFKTDGIHKPIGTGFFVNNDAEIITANHVIEGGNKELARARAFSTPLNLECNQHHPFYRELSRIRAEVMGKARGIDLKFKY